jgi:GDPmannose 4,6-dehydratase
MARALVLGVNGQDGSYLAQALLLRGYDVVGIGRNVTSRYLSGESHFTYIMHDLRASESLVELIRGVEPHEVYHFAAVHGAIDAGFTYEAHWRDMMRVNVFALHVLLEHARTRSRDMRLIYAGSAKIFPPPFTGNIDEATPTRATCLYGIGKLASQALLFQYKQDHGIDCTNLILFNHDSARRPSQFFLPTMARAIAGARRDNGYQVKIQTLDFRVDWSAADELMDIVADLGRIRAVPNLVVASGTTIYARTFAQELFARYGLDARRHIVEELAPHDPGPEFRVCIDRLANITGRRPSKTAFDIVDNILTYGNLGA